MSPWPYIVLGFLILFAIQTVAIVVAFRASSGFEYFRPTLWREKYSCFGRREAAVNCDSWRDSAQSQLVQIQPAPSTPGPLTAVSKSGQAPTNFDPRSELTPELRDKMKSRFVDELRTLKRQIEDDRYCKLRCVQCGVEWNTGCVDVWRCDKCYLSETWHDRKDFNGTQSLSNEQDGAVVAGGEKSPKLTPGNVGSSETVRDDLNLRKDPASQSKLSTNHPAVEFPHNKSSGASREIPAFTGVFNFPAQNRLENLRNPK